MGDRERGREPLFWDFDNPCRNNLLGNVNGTPRCLLLLDLTGENVGISTEEMVFKVIHLCLLNNFYREIAKLFTFLEIRWPNIKIYKYINMLLYRLPRA